jgi:hypothetical protein
MGLEGILTSLLSPDKSIGNVFQEYGCIAFQNF